MRVTKKRTMGGWSIGVSYLQGSSRLGPHIAYARHVHLVREVPGAKPGSYNRHVHAFPSSLALRARTFEKSATPTLTEGYRTLGSLSPFAAAVSAAEVQMGFMGLPPSSGSCRPEVTVTIRQSGASLETAPDPGVGLLRRKKSKAWPRWQAAKVSSMPSGVKVGLPPVNSAALQTSAMRGGKRHSSTSLWVEARETRSRGI